MNQKAIREQQRILNAKIKQLDDERRTATIELEMLQSTCSHPNIVDKHGTGDCPDCGFRTKGWFCKTSPTKECDYYDEENDEYNEDCCIYCGAPDERK